MAITIQARATKGGTLLVFFAINAANGQLVAITSVPSNPTVLINGSGTTLYGPVGTDTSHQLTYVAYQVTSPAAILSTDVLTYSASAGMIVTASGSSPSASGAPIENYVGQDESPIAGVPGFAVTPTLPLGLVLSPAPANAFNKWFPFKNWRLKLSSLWHASSGSVTQTADAQPISWTPSAVISAVFHNTAAANGIDAQGYPTQLGTWTIQYDDPNAANGNRQEFWINGNANATGLDGTLSRSVGVRTVSGTTVTITYANVGRVVSPTNLDFFLTLYSSQAQGTWNISNLWIFAPGNSIDRSVPFALDDNALRQMRSAGGKYPDFLRAPFGLGGADGIDNTVDAIDRRKPTDFTWRIPVPLAANVVAVRHLNTNPGDGTYAWSSTKMYSNAFPWGGTDGNGSYMPLATTDNGAFLDEGLGGSPDGWWCMECRTAAPHGFKSGQLVVFDLNAPNAVPMSTGVTVSARNLSVPAWVTGPSLFVVNGFSGNIVSGSTINTVNSTSEITTNFTATVTTPIDSVMPIEAFGAACQQIGADPWVNAGIATSAAAQTILAEALASVITDDKVALLELGNEHWAQPAGIAQVNLVCGAVGRLLGYLPNNTPIGNYYHTTGTTLGRSRAYSLLANLAHEQFAAVLGEDRLIRFFGGQWATGPLSTTSIISFCNQYNIPCGAVGSAPYDIGPNDTTIVQAFSSGGTNPGNWSCETILDFERYQLKFNTVTWQTFTDQYNLLQSYTGPACTGQVDGKPSARAYEASIQQIVRATVTNYVAVQHDLYYTGGLSTQVTYADAERAFYQQIQVGNPYIPGSGFYRANKFELANYWDGPAQQQLFGMAIWPGQLAGTGVGTTNTSQSTQAGVTPGPQQFITAQGGAPGNGIAYDQGNDSISLDAYHRWIEIANSSPIPELLVYVDPRAAQLVSSASDADPFGVDPRGAQLVSAASDADPYGVDPRGAQLVH